jgi:hypothetical protein
MNQNIWGSHLWFSLHTISFNYPLNPTIDDKKDYKNFFLNLQNVIPCSVCKKNYMRHIKEHPIDNYLDNRKKIVYWVIDMHNMVNAEIGKKILSYDVVLKKYEKVYNKKILLDNNKFLLNKEENFEIINNNNYYNYNNIIYYFIIFLLLLFIINLIIFYTKSKKKL